MKARVHIGYTIINHKPCRGIAIRGVNWRTVDLPEPRTDSAYFFHQHRGDAAAYFCPLLLVSIFTIGTVSARHCFETASCSVWIDAD